MKKISKGKNLLKTSIISFSLFVFLSLAGSSGYVFAANGTPCTGWPNCGGTSAGRSTCSPGERCVPPILGQTTGSCALDTNCATNPTPCTPVGKCGDGFGVDAFKSNCPVGQMCASIGGGTCVPDSINCSTSNCIALGDDCVIGGGWPCCDNYAICRHSGTHSSATCVGVPPPSPSSSSALCGTDNLGVDTAIGCLMAGDPKQLISQLLGWGVGVGGGIAFLMIVLAGFQIATASGDPKKVQAARELLMSAIAGLLLIIFSILLLNLIGFQILKLPGFNVNLL